MTKAHPPTLPIAHSKTAALARVLDLVPKGYVFYTAGQCPTEKLPMLLTKFHNLYGIGCSPAQRSLRKSRGQANASLIVFQRPIDEEFDAESTVDLPAKPAAESAQSQAKSVMPKDEVHWLLLVTPGTGAVHEKERLQAIQNRPRLLWLEYELVQLAKRGQASWTWRRTKEEMAALYAHLSAQFNARRADQIRETLLRISRQPGFAGVRNQGKELFAFVRSKGYKDELPKLFFVQKVSAGKRLNI